MNHQETLLHISSVGDIPNSPKESWQYVDDYPTWAQEKLEAYERYVVERFQAISADQLLVVVHNGSNHLRRSYEEVEHILDQALEARRFIIVSNPTDMLDLDLWPSRHLDRNFMLTTIVFDDDLVTSPYFNPNASRYCENEIVLLYPNGQYGRANGLYVGSTDQDAERYCGWRRLYQAYLLPHISEV